MSAERFPIAYLAPVFPARSETFVYREVRALRARGWTVATASLAAPEPAVAAELADVAGGTRVVYRGWLATAAAELVAHPLRGLGTLATATGDAVAPGERLALKARLKLLAQAAAGLSLARRLRGPGVEHLHCHFAHAPASVGMYAAMQLGIPFSFTGHANDLFQRRVLLRRKLRRAAFVGCISEWHRELYERIEPDSGGKYRILRCGVDVGAWEPRAEGQGAHTDGTLRVLTVCRLVEKKGIDTLVSAVGRLVRDGRRVRLTVAGDGPLQGSLTRLAEAEGCGGAVEWLGAVSNERVRGLMASADVFALPCRTDAQGDRDGIPVVLMEAMACGVPVVAGDLPAVRELVGDGATGVLVPGGDAGALAGRLERLEGVPEERARLGAAGRARVISEFALDVNIDRLEGALDFARRSVGARGEGAQGAR